MRRQAGKKFERGELVRLSVFLGAVCDYIILNLYACISHRAAVDVTGKKQAV
jgi:hypothetical protein